MCKSYKFWFWFWFWFLIWSWILLVLIFGYTSFGFDFNFDIIIWSISVARVFLFWYLVDWKLKFTQVLITILGFIFDLMWPLAPIWTIKVRFLFFSSSSSQNIVIILCKGGWKSNIWFGNQKLLRFWFWYLIWKLKVEQISVLVFDLISLRFTVRFFFPGLSVFQALQALIISKSNREKRERFRLKI